jgi:nucleoside 2-deoxyribosyltransferase
LEKQLLMHSIYFAGELFTAKHLIGNSGLAAAIERQSAGEFIGRLPQALEQRADSAQQIRDQDLETLIECDLAIFNFDGTEIDSGTVVEFMVAKFADIPSLLLRTDFRKGGDQGDDPWNLMMSFYPRTRSCLLDCMSLYKEAMAKGCDYHEASLTMLENIAQRVVAELRLLLQTPPCLPAPLADQVYDWLGRFAQFESPDSTKKIRAALKNKIARGLLARSLL